MKILSKALAMVLPHLRNESSRGRRESTGGDAMGEEDVEIGRRDADGDANQPRPGIPHVISFGETDGDDASALSENSSGLAEAGAEAPPAEVAVGPAPDGLFDGSGNLDVDGRSENFSGLILGSNLIDGSVELLDEWIDLMVGRDSVYGDSDSSEGAGEAAEIVVDSDAEGGTFWRAVRDELILYRERRCSFLTDRQADA